MKIKESFLALIGLSSERFEKLSEGEQTQLTTLSESLSAAQDAQVKAEADLATANAQLGEFTTQLADANALVAAHVATIEANQATITAHEGTIAAHVTTIATHEATIAELKAELDNTPGAGETKVIKGAEGVPGQKTRPKRSWEVD